MFFVYIVGTAGSGKTTLTKALAEWLEDHEMSACKVNLDPAVRILPYYPEVDVRRYVNYEALLKEGLGPNGAMLKSIDLMLDAVDDMRREIEECLANYVLIDTPGQIELFAFRRVTGGLVRGLSGNDKSALLYLIDSSAIVKSENSLDPYAFSSLALLGTSLKVRFSMPQVNAVNKVDLLSLSQRTQLEGWLENLTSAAFSIDGAERGLVIKLLEAIEDAGGFGEILPISTLTEEGLDELYASLQRSFYGGEDYATEEPSARL